MAYRAIRWGQLSLRNKLTLVIVALLTLGLVIAGIGTTLLLRPALIEQLDNDLTGAAANPALIVGGNVATQNFSYEDVRSAPQSYYVAVVVSGDKVHNWGDRPAAQLPDLTTVPEIAEQPTSPTSPYRIVTLQDSLGAPWRAVVVPESEYRSNSVSGTLVIALPMLTVERTMASFLAIFFGFGLTVVIFGAALTRILVSATLQPLREVEATAISFAAGDYAQRLSGATPNTEVGRLSRSLNTMLGRIDAAIDERSRTIDQMRRFVGDASHELRTPLVTVRGYAELYRMGALDEPEKVAQAMDRVEKEALRMGGLVEDLLQLARLDESRELVKNIIDLEPLTEDAAMDATAQAPDRLVRAVGVRILPPGGSPAQPPSPVVAVNAPTGDEPSATVAAPASAAEPETGERRRRWLVPRATAPTRADVLRLLRFRPNTATGTEAGAELTVTADTSAPVHAGEGHDAGDLPAMVHANEDKVRQAISNLVGNALRYTPAGSPLEIGVALDPDAREAIVEIIDHGEGIPEPIRRKIFERFWRADTSRDRETGGSGLGLAIVSAIMRASSGRVDVVETPGGGATFRLIFPLLMAEDVDDLPSTGPSVDPGDDEAYT